jgi:hypothetical protein
VEAILERTETMTEPFSSEPVPDCRGEEGAILRAWEPEAVAIPDESPRRCSRDGTEPDGGDWLWEATSDPAFRLKQ